MMAKVRLLGNGANKRPLETRPHPRFIRQGHSASMGLHFWKRSGSTDTDCQPKHLPSPGSVKARDVRCALAVRYGV